MRRVSEPGRIVTVVLLIGAAACLPEQAPAQGWKPVKNVELIVPGGAGGGQDRTVRIMQKIMQQGLVPTSWD